ncbi:MAG: hypothetical protein GTN49_03385 [candidate division Zixibacteria bacterium]|nr:hypothetical protein [candidate division Zixibacteria bacterium]
MKKRFWIVAALAVAAAGGATTPPPVLEEDFEGTKFPPEGWTVGGFGVWGWSNPGGYAEGYARNTPGTWSRCRITTRPFRLDAAARVRAAFRYETIEYGGADAHYSIYLTREGFQYGEALPRTTGWEKYEWLSPLAPYGVDLKIFWDTVVSHPYNYGTGIFRLDDVVFTAYNIFVAPTSIGRVKALYY